MQTRGLRGAKVCGRLWCRSVNTAPHDRALTRDGTGPPLLSARVLCAFPCMLTHFIAFVLFVNVLFLKCWNCRKHCRPPASQYFPAGWLAGNFDKYPQFKIRGTRCVPSSVGDETIGLAWCRDVIWWQDVERTGGLRVREKVGRATQWLEETGSPSRGGGCRVGQKGRDFRDS